MPLPQVNERIKEVPAQALRAVFAGIGQVLLVADKIRHRAVEQVSGTATTTTTTATAPPREAPPTGPAAAPSTAPAETQSTPDSARWRSLDETGNVRLISEDDEAAEPAASAPPAPDTTAPASDAPPADQPQPPVGQAPADQAPADRLPEVTETPATPAASETPAAPQAPAAQAPAAPKVPAAPGATEPGALPLSNYDELTIASLRARLRVLSPAQVSTLLEYEKATEGRPAVITMFERRLAKLEQEGS